ncbi:cyclopropane-fatty-acyl-phospholipid synthase [Xanthomonas citri pv. citri]|uniref:class I SAM-dependent methyltransferase n=1 Tax=Xanthomonas citri TaxID=346 RepID=UPI0036D9CBAC
MNATSLPDHAAPRAASWTDRLLRKRLLATLGQLRDGQLQLHEAGTVATLGTATGAQALQMQLRVIDPGFYRQAALNGSVGAGESYMDGQWQCDDLVALMRLLLRNRERLDAMETGTARLGGLTMRSLHAFARNTRSGSRRNIAAHYDLGNPLFKLFLDENLMYSSAIFVDGEEAQGEAALERAATRKLERICQKLRLAPHHHVVEIGTGWGGFALHAAREHGCRVTTTTISREQFELANQRIAAAGLSDRVTVLLRDYRDLEGRFDRVVSIEMIEAIGHQYLDTYFAKVGSLLADDGEALIQAITIEDHRYKQALHSVDFIKRHIFPGSFIPSVAAMTGAVARASDLRLFNLEDIGPSYALTLRAWRQRFMAQLPQVRALGYDERFIRMWEFYLAYCEAGFLERSIGDVHLWLNKPGARPPQFVPGLTADA